MNKKNRFPLLLPAFQLEGLLIWAIGGVLFMPLIISWALRAEVYVFLGVAVFIYLTVIGLYIARVRWMTIAIIMVALVVLLVVYWAIFSGDETKPGLLLFGLMLVSVAELLIVLIQARKRIRLIEEKERLLKEAQALSNEEDDDFNRAIPATILKDVYILSSTTLGEGIRLMVLERLEKAGAVHADLLVNVLEDEELSRSLFDSKLRAAILRVLDRENHSLALRFAKRMNSDTFRVVRKAAREILKSPHELTR